MSAQPPEYPSKFYAQLLFFAQADLGMAEKALQPPVYWHEACFLARECAEKTLKGFLEAAGKPSPPVHGLIMLLRECIAIDREFGRFHRHCQTLLPYQSEARYPEPESTYEFTAEEAAEAVCLARELFDTVRSKIAQRTKAGLL